MCILKNECQTLKLKLKSIKRDILDFWVACYIVRIFASGFGSSLEYSYSQRKHVHITLEKRISKCFPRCFFSFSAMDSTTAVIISGFSQKFRGNIKLRFLIKVLLINMMSSLPVWFSRPRPFDILLIMACLSQFERWVLMAWWGHVIKVLHYPIQYELV